MEQTGVLILDIQLPGINGFELQNNLNAVNSQLEIIFISAYTQPGDRERALKKGAKGFLEKPFDDEELLSLVNFQLAEKGSKR